MFHRCLSHIFYYIPKFGSGCNLGKDLSKDKRDGQLVKHIDTGLYLLLIRKKWEKHNEASTTIWDAD